MILRRKAVGFRHADNSHDWHRLCRAGLRRASPPTSATSSPASTGRGEDRRSRKGSIPIFEPGLDSMSRATLRPQAGCSSKRSQVRHPLVRMPSSSPSARLRGAATASPTSLRLRGCPRDRARMSGFTVVVPIDGSGRHQRRGRGDHPGDPSGRGFRGRVNPELLARLAAIEDFKRPDRVVVGTDDERRARSDRRSTGRCSSTRRGSCSPIGARPTDQVTRRMLFRHQDHVHQRDRRSLRVGRRQRAGDRARHRARPPHRREVLARGSRLRRFLLSQGHRRARRHRPALQLTGAHRRHRDRVERRAQTAIADKIAAASAAGARQDARRAR